MEGSGFNPLFYLQYDGLGWLPFPLRQPAFFLARLTRKWLHGADVRGFSGFFGAFFL
jgi:hypothetical protein